MVSGRRARCEKDVRLCGSIDLAAHYMTWLKPFVTIVCLVAKEWGKLS